MTPDALLFATHARKDSAVQEGVAEMDRLHAAASLFRSHPDYATPARVTDTITRLLGSGAYRLLDPGRDM